MRRHCNFDAPRSGCRRFCTVSRHSRSGARSGSSLFHSTHQFPETLPWPKNASARAVARAVSAEMHSSFAALRNEAPMNCRKRFPGYRLSERALKDIRRIQQLWKYCREGFGSGGPWLFGNFSIADAMYAPVVMRFRSIDVELDKVAMDYCATVNGCASVKQWVSLGFDETEVVAGDELDWPGETITPGGDR